jgi:hypothetical protein
VPASARPPCRVALSVMMAGESERNFIGRLLGWAGRNGLIRASPLTSTRATQPAAVGSVKN